MNSDTPDHPDGTVSAGAKVQPKATRSVLNRTDQRCVATIAALAMVAIGISCFGLGDRQRALVDLRYPVVIQIDQIGFKLDVNRADWPEWTQLPRIGETLARRIVESRDEGGLFQAHEDLTRVSGIGPKTLANMRPYLLAIEPQDAVGRP